MLKVSKFYEVKINSIKKLKPALGRKWKKYIDNLILHGCTK